MNLSKNENLCPKPPPVFARDATGLVRQLSAWDAFVISFGIFNVGSGTGTFVAYTLAMYPGADLLLSLAIMNIVSLAFALLYAFMSIAMPRSGGDYIWVSRVLHPALGVMNGISVTVWMMFLIAYQMWLTTSYGLPVSFDMVGSFMNSEALRETARLLSSSNYVFMDSVILLLFFSLLAIYSTKLTMRVGTIMLVIAFIAYPVTYCILLIPMSSSTFAQLFNNYAGANMYNNVISQASEGGLKELPTLNATLLSLPIAFLVYSGFNWVSSAAGEVKRASRSMIYGLVGAQLFGWIMFSLVVYVALNTFGHNFIESLGYIFYNNPSMYPLPLPSPWINYLVSIAVYQLPYGLALVNFINFGFMLWFSIFGTLVMITITRNIFALSFDRVFPSALADVSDRFHTPVKAIVLTFAIGVFMLYLLIYTNLFFFLLNMTLGLSVATILPGIAGVLLPYRRKEIFDASPGFVKAKIGPVPVISILGVIVTISFAILSIIMATNPLLSGVTGGSLGFIAALIIIGFAVYYISRAYQKQKGIDIALAFQQIPPE